MPIWAAPPEGSTMRTTQPKADKSETIKAETTPYVEAFRARLAAIEPKWLVALREAALRRFAELGFPTRRDEAWRFTNLRPLSRAAFLPAAPDAETVDRAALASYLLAGKTHRIVLVNGHFAPGLSKIGALPQGIWLGSTAEALKTRPELVEAAFDESENTGAQAFASLNAAFFADGFILALEPGAVLETPVEIVHIGRASSTQAFYLRSAVLAGAGSSATVIESFAGTGSGWTNAVTRIDLGQGARLAHVKIQDEPQDAIHFALVRASLAAGARYENFTLTLGALLSRQDSLVAMQGEHAELSLAGAYLLRGRQEATIAPYVDHQSPGGKTREIVKGVVDDHAHGVFLGTIAVRPGADRTDAHQLNRNLLLSPGAAVDTKPELEIFADDVKCSHGATVGDLDENALFYLRARGIDEASARNMLIEAFAADAIDSAGLGATLTAHLRRHLQLWLEKRGSPTP